MNFKCVVIDDEQHAVDAMVRYIGDVPNLELAKTFTSSLQALQSIHAADGIDFIFLDIEMPGISGLELAEGLRSKTRFLVFTTSHAKHALKAFDLQANQYLLKPISFAKFALIIDSLLKGIAPPAEAARIAEKRLKFVKADHKNSYHYIDPDEIIFIQAAKNYVHIFTERDDIITHMGLNHVEEALSPNDFIRISKSYIIAKNAIRKIEGNLVRLKKNNEIFQVGETYKANFVAFIKKNMM